jgi:cellulose synthase/poly-beta-1,6-N-acetylglucosamine synthase-like glycosyltransferase
METLQHIVTAVNLLALAILFAYGANCYVLILTYRRHHRDTRRRHAELNRRFHEELPARGWPCITVQLPVYNERYVVRRLMDAVGRLDYPRERLEIQVLDDSTDDTSGRVQAMVRRMRAWREHRAIHRERRMVQGRALRHGCDRRPANSRRLRRRLPAAPIFSKDPAYFQTRRPEWCRRLVT